MNLSSFKNIEIFLICMLYSVVLGAALALLHKQYTNNSKGFIITIAILPAIVQLVIMLVNGNLGTGVRSP